jgi:hypothetical protein
MAASGRLSRLRPGTGCGVHRRGCACLSGTSADQEIEAILNELAVELGAVLGQERLYVAFCHWTRILDAGEREG